MNQPHVPDPKLLDALAGLDAEADRAVVQRTRRSVMETANNMREAQSRRRYQTGLVLLAVGMLLMFLTPTLWALAEDVFSGEHWLGVPMLTALLVLTTVSTVFIAVIAQWGSRSPGESA